MSISITKAIERLEAMREAARNLMVRTMKNTQPPHEAPLGTLLDNVLALEMAVKELQKLVHLGAGSDAKSG